MATLPAVLGYAQYPKSLRIDALRADAVDPISSFERDLLDAPTQSRETAPGCTFVAARYLGRFAVDRCGY
jgi:hypothetical protein